MVESSDGRSCGKKGDAHRLKARDDCGKGEGTVEGEGVGWGWGGRCTGERYRVCVRTVIEAVKTNQSNMTRGIPTRMVHLKHDIQWRYTILVGNPRIV